MTPKWPGDLARSVVAVAIAACLSLPLTLPAQEGTTPPRSASVADDGSNQIPVRTIVTTDPELDDLNSLLRMLLYSNEIDIPGLVYSASQHHYRGDETAGVAPHRWPAPGDRLHIDEAVDRYEEVYANLVVHDLRPEWTRDHVSDVGPIGDSYRVWGDGKQMAAGFDDEDYFGLSGQTADELRAMGYRIWLPPQPKGAWISEGDSSNFALLIQNGLRNHEDPGYGGWGGRQAINPDDPFQWRNRDVEDIGPDGSPRSDYSASRWFEDFQLDFAARLRWSVTPAHKDANHEPRVTVPSRLNVDVEAGQTFRLVGAASDPDGDDLTATWWQYREAGTCDGIVDVVDPANLETDVRVPADAPAGSTIHLILEVEDAGAPSMTSYQRVVITVVG